jgi:hypothetical protein
VKLYAIVHTRTSWEPCGLTSYDLGEVDLEKLVQKLNDVIDEDTFLVDVQLWNERKVSKLQKG